MEIKKHLVLFNTLMFCVFAAQASPLVSLGDYGNVFFNGSYSTIWRSNVLFAEDDEEEDLLFIVSPGLELDLGSQVSNFDLNLSTKYDIQRYDELTDFDREYFSIRGTSSYDAVRWSLNGMGNFEERESTTGQESANLRNVNASNTILLDNANQGQNTSGLLSTANDINDSVANLSNLILLDITDAKLIGRYQISPKFSFGSGVRYSDRRYTNSDQLADNQSFSFPFDLFYQLTPKLDLVLGYRFVTNDVGSSIRPGISGNYLSERLVIDENNQTIIAQDYVNQDFANTFVDSHNQESHFFNIGVNGKMLPKLSGSFRIGYTEVNPESSDVKVTGTTTAATFTEVSSPNSGTITITNPNTREERYVVPDDNTKFFLIDLNGEEERLSRSTLGLNGDLTYLITPKLTSTIMLNRGFDVGSEGQTVLSSSARINTSYSISAKYFAGAFLGYTLREFGDGGNAGDDDIYEAGVNLSYVPDQYLRFSTGYSYIENDSERQNQGFVNHSVNLSVSFRY